MINFAFQIKCFKLIEALFRHITNMEIQGKIIASLPEVGGTSKAGNTWKKKEYVLETHDNFPKKVCFNFFGDRVDQFPLNIGDEVTVSFDIESREYQGRWYTDIRAWKAEKATSASTNEMAMPSAPTVDDPFGLSEEKSDDLPF